MTGGQSRSRRGRRRRRGDDGESPPARRVRARWSTRASQLVLWLLVAAGPVAGGMALASESMPSVARPVAAPTSTPSPPPSSAAAEGVAELVVTAWLTGDEQALRRFYDGPVRLDAAGRFWPRRTAVVAVDRRAAGYWAVTVAADVFAYVDAGDGQGDAPGDGEAAGGWRPRGVRYFRVGVVKRAGSLAATSLPGEVAGPPSEGELVELAVESIGSTAVDEPPVQAVEAFLGALLAGDGEVGRYTTAGLEVSAVSPPPHERVEVVRAGTVERGADRRLVRVEAEATDERGHARIVAYSLEVVRRQGRWEVAALHPAAAVVTRSPEQGGR